MSPLPTGQALFIYETLYEHKGKILPKETWKALTELTSCRSSHYRAAHLVNQLNDFYGCDIRNFGHNKWSLVGEWVGKVYLDYTQQVHQRQLEGETLSDTILRVMSTAGKGKN